MRTLPKRLHRIFFSLLLITLALASLYLFTETSAAQQTEVGLPSELLKYGVFTAQFDPAGSFSIEGERYPRGTTTPRQIKLNGTWKSTGNEIEFVMPGGSANCVSPGRYRVRREGSHVRFEFVSDACRLRISILDGSNWAPATEIKTGATRNITITAGERVSLPRTAKTSKGSWPSFRGTGASGIADGQNLPDEWDAKTGKNILWKTPIPGLAHSSPVVWGNQIFVTTAISSDPKASFRPGLYGEGAASKDHTRHRWMLYAVDKKSGKIIWERLVHEGEPLEKRHIKATYANSTPATDGRVVVAWFGSQGVYAYDIKGRFLWKVDLGRLDVGAYDMPAFEWGPASSPILWNNLVILQCDTHADSFLLALDAATGQTVWKTAREELPSWGTPTVATTSAGPVLVTNGSNYIRGYDPQTGRELWRLGGSSKITAPTPIFAEDLFVIVSGRAPERPIFVVRPNARNDITLANGKTANDAVVWSKTGRGSYMPTPLVYKRNLYVLANNGTFDAYDLKTGKEFYRQRLPVVGSGFSASPVAADDKIYLSNEDGEILVVAAGEKFQHLATNSMDELLMATPALSEGVMYVRSSSSLIAIGRKR
ncbi:MAG TPA: PQQ-binding-like beta-propeller repeat protein [Pyrinomonadaceae bacterium]|nr:PQQ-binding-like beta-propeller repeat protein [Pyrinomonadaceae bacterium]